MRLHTFEQGNEKLNMFSRRTVINHHKQLKHENMGRKIKEEKPNCLWCVPVGGQISLQALF
jgi:hypothetical protein